MHTQNKLDPVSLQIPSQQTPIHKILTLAELGEDLICCFQAKISLQNYVLLPIHLLKRLYTK